jgi:hypothetical protein
MRGTPRFVAGSRFRFTPDYIDFNYDALVNAIADAIDKEAAAAGASLVTNEPMSKQHLNEPSYDFEKLMSEFQTVVGDIMSKTPGLAPKITAIVDKHLGKGKKVGDCTPEQAPQIDLILFDIKRL